MPAFPYVLTTPIGREIISSELDVVGSGESHLRATLNQVSGMQADGGSSGIASVDFLVKKGVDAPQVHLRYRLCALECSPVFLRPVPN